ncbi:MAG: hypothetical protein WD512_14955 [Candidatus Paceibacterota bacterium]
MIKLPKLVEETILFYMLRDFKTWKKSIEVIHKEYKDRVYREDDIKKWDYDCIYYKIPGYCKFCVVSKKEIEHQRKINIFYRYDMEYVGLRVPNNYVYTSEYPDTRSFSVPKSLISRYRLKI